MRIPALSRRFRRAGFTLTELAVVLAIVGLLLGTMTYTLSAQIEQRNRDDTRRRLEEARELVLGFAIVNGRLPCPASTTSGGSESPAGGACTNPYDGYLPAKAVGFQPIDASGYGLDAWGNRIRYAVSANSNVSGSPDNNFTTAGSMKTNGITVTPSDLIICGSWAANVDVSTSSPSCGSAASVTNTSLVAAVIWSQGKNFSTASSGGVSGQSGNDEMLNNKTSVNSNHGVFVDHVPAPSGASGGEFDDQLVWIPVGHLYSRLISASVLP
jgi:prepilin-type N-terminal cleavage/methylation domain-containing protein